jgi:acetyltransferase-like isoleucine patch superfamily enzyme
MKLKFEPIWRECRAFGAQALMKLPCGADWVQGIRAWRAQRGCRAWMKAQKANGCYFSPQASFLRNYGYTSVTSEPGLFIDPGVTIWISNDAGAQPELVFGKRVYVGRHTYLGVYLPIRIGDNTIIGAYSYIISANHRFDSRKLPIRDQGYAGAAIHIGEDVWIGTHVVILPGVKIGKGAIIAAGSVLNAEVPEYQIWGGMPAHFLKMRPV